jgi:nitroimidazol reductase NimA-like FMN-containing flavoprotein (pyridoxamine 5'-phosphate oxidase superfamily)
MIEIQEMQNEEIEDLLSTVNYGHLACARNNLPYVVPIHFAYVSPYIFVYTTEGKKSEIIKVNPEVCLQLEEVKNKRDWRSVIVSGEATQLNNEIERQEAMDAIVKVNPTLTPAVSIRWMDSWVRENVEVIYRITPRVITGRKSVDRSEMEGFVPERRRPNIY